MDIAVSAFCGEIFRGSHLAGGGCYRVIFVLSGFWRHHLCPCPSVRYLIDGTGGWTLALFGWPSILPFLAGLAGLVMFECTHNDDGVRGRPGGSLRTHGALIGVRSERNLS